MTLYFKSIHELQIERVGDWNLFEFTDSLQLRMENLLEKKKENLLSAEDVAELEAIGELDRTVTHINAKIAANSVN